MEEFNAMQKQLDDFMLPIQTRFNLHMERENLPDVTDITTVKVKWKFFKIFFVISK